MIPNTYPTLNFNLGETADMLRDQVGAFAADEIAPIAAEIDRSDEFPRHLWPKMGDLGGCWAFDPTCTKKGHF